MEQVDEEAQNDETEAKGNEEAMQEDQEPPSAPSNSSRVNEYNFQLVFGRLDSLATSIGNPTTNFDNFSSMVTKNSRLMMSTLLLWKHPWRKSMSI